MSKYTDRLEKIEKELSLIKAVVQVQCDKCGEMSSYNSVKFIWAPQFTSKSPYVRCSRCHANLFEKD